jgi:nitroreductase
MAQAVAKKIDEILSWPEAKGQEARIEAYRPLYTFFDQAPVVIAVFGCDVSSLIGGIFTQRGLKRRVSSAQQSVAAAIENLLLAAQALGYGACWMTGPLIAAEELESLINLGNPWYLVALVPIGKPTEKPSPRRRKPLSEVVSYR